MTKIDLINGFLGSGKTTFIRHLLPWLSRRGERVAVVENEFGSAGVDTAILSAAGAQVTELAGGCICCGQKVNFYHLLCELCGSGEWDRILVEPSGVFNCDDFLDIVGQEDVQAHGRLNTIVTVLAPADLTAEGAQRELLYSQLHSSGAILLSQRDGPTDGMAGQVRSQVSELLSSYGQSRAYSGLIVDTPWEKLDDGQMNALLEAGWNHGEHLRSHLDHSRFAQSLMLWPHPIASPDVLRDALARAVDGSCGTVYRIKGCVEGTDGTLWQVNATPSVLSVLPIDSWDGGRILNVIGSSLDRTRLHELLK